MIVKIVVSYLHFFCINIDFDDPVGQYRAKSISVEIRIRQAIQSVIVTRKFEAIKSDFFVRVINEKLFL